MNNLARARVKAMEQIPEWAKCCDAYFRCYQAEGEFDVDLSDTYPSKGLQCKFCNAERPEIVGIWSHVQPFGAYLPIEMLDLDEVPPELQSDKYVDSMSKARTTAERIGGIGG